MKNFLSKILTHRDSFYPESISQNEKIKITDIVVKHFNLKDANQLRDKLRHDNILTKVERLDGEASIDWFNKCLIEYIN